MIYLPWTLRTLPFTSPRGAWARGDRVKGLPIKCLGGQGSHLCLLLYSSHRSGLFVFSDCGMGVRRWSEPNNQKLLENPDPNPDPIAESTLDSVDKIALSLCGGLADSRDISLGMFSHAVSHCKD